MSNSLVSLVCVGRFHHFHLARQLERKGLLHSITTGYPRFKLRDEAGVPAEKIRTFPWIHTPTLVQHKLHLRCDRAARELSWWDHEAVDWYGSLVTHEVDTVIALSSSGLHCAKNAKRLGKQFICDRGSSHIRFQDELLAEEYSRWGLQFQRNDPRILNKEEAEYELADRVLVPSQFAMESFQKMGVSSEKLAKIPYGANLSRFSKTSDPAEGEFQVLFVGALSIRKGFLYLLDAFTRLKHPKKRLIAVGHLTPEVRELISRFSIENVEFLGNVANSELKALYSRSHVFVLPSVEEGLSMVQGEALACGCPVIATTNTGGADLFSNNSEGFIVAIRDPDAILEKLELLAADRSLRDQMGAAAIERVRSLGGWDRYGDDVANLVASMAAST